MTDLRCIDPEDGEPCRWLDAAPCRLLSTNEPDLYYCIYHGETVDLKYTPRCEHFTKEDKP
jgi:hypothetical protein